MSPIRKLGVSLVLLVVGSVGCDRTRQHAPDGLEEQALRASAQQALAIKTAAPLPVVPPLNEPKSTTSKTAAGAKTKPSAATASARTGELKVKRLVVAQGVEGREPMGQGSVFKKGELDKLFAFVELENTGNGPTDIVVSFEPPGDAPARGNVELAVGESPRWRTWAFTRTIDRTGTWIAVVRTKDGRELARERFEVEA